MLSAISTRRVAWCLVASVIATVVAAVIAFLVALYVPSVTGPDQAQPPSPGKTLTLEELKQAEREAKERMKRRKEQFDRESLGERIEEIKRRGLPISWLPWIVLPFVFRLKQRMELLPLFVIPAVLVLTPFVIAWELVTYLAALLLGAAIAFACIARGTAS